MIIPAKMMTACTTSVTITAFRPPWNCQGTPSLICTAECPFKQILHIKEEEMSTAVSSIGGYSTVKKSCDSHHSCVDRARPTNQQHRCPHRKPRHWKIILYSITSSIGLLV